MLPKEPENLGPSKVEQQPIPSAPAEIQPIVEAAEIPKQVPELQQTIAPAETQLKIEGSANLDVVPQTTEIPTIPVVEFPVEAKLPAITDEEKSVYQHIETIAETDPASAFARIAQLRKENLAKHYGVNEETPEQKAA